MLEELTPLTTGRSVQYRALLTSYQADIQGSGKWNESTRPDDYE